jgi:hypothetical protein
MSDPIEGCPHCGATLAAKDLDGSAYYLCGSVGEKRTAQCRMYSKNFQKLLDARDEIKALKEQLLEKDELIQEYRACVRPGDLKHMRE